MELSIPRWILSTHLTGIITNILRLGLSSESQVAREVSPESQVVRNLLTETTVDQGLSHADPQFNNSTLPGMTLH
jgi:hypothetical protein